MVSRRQSLLNLYARSVQKPALALIRSHWLARRVFSLNAMMSYRQPKGLALDDLALGGVPATVCRIGGDRTHGTLLYLHGGAFTMGNIRGYRHLLALMAQKAGMRGVYIDYRLAPEHPFPAAVNDAEAAYRALLDDPDSGPICVVGDSAGGNLTLSLILRLKRLGLPLPVACACLSPATDLRLQNPSLAANARADRLVPLSWGKRGVEAYLAGHSPDDPEASPLLGDFTGAPPIYLCCDRSEVLYDDCRLMARRLREAGVDVTFSEHEGLMHVWQLNAGRSPEADASVAEIAAFLKRHVTQAR